MEIAPNLEILADSVVIRGREDAGDVSPIGGVESGYFGGAGFRCIGHWPKICLLQSSH
jgi:hypothetical protein